MSDINPHWYAVNKERSQNDWKGETSKARNRRLAEGWFEKYAPDDFPGLDLGCAEDPLNETFRRWDVIFGDGDATLLEGVPKDKFQTVYASHLLEHLAYPVQAVRRWYEVVRPGGYLIIIVPHRDLYEKKRILPSNWNPEHTYFWLPDEEEPPCTKSLRKVIAEAIPGANLVEFRVLQDGYDHTLSKDEHPVGEYSIEAVIKKWDLIFNKEDLWEN